MKKNIEPTPAQSTNFLWTQHLFSFSYQVPPTPLLLLLQKITRSPNCLNIQNPNLVNAEREEGRVQHSGAERQTRVDMGGGEQEVGYGQYEGEDTDMPAPLDDDYLEVEEEDPQSGSNSNVHSPIPHTHVSIQLNWNQVCSC